jgi:hypothetical protein
MWRSVLLGAVLAGMLAGCSLGSGSGVGAVNEPAARHRDTALVVDVKETATSGPVVGPSRTYNVACGDRSKGDAAVSVVCSQLTNIPTRYFGAPARTTLTHGPGTLVVTVRGLETGIAVKHSYRFGEAPQFANWIRLLRRAYPDGL